MRSSRLSEAEMGCRGVAARPPSQLYIIDQDPFGLGWLGSTQRLFAISRALRVHDWVTTAIGGRRPRVRRHPEIEQAFPGTVIRTPFPAGAWPRAWDYPYIRGVWIRAARAGGKGHLLADPEFHWAPLMGEWALRLAAKTGRPDIIWGISYGNLTAVAAARRVSERLEVPLVIEFQDPCPPPGRRLGPEEKTAMTAALRQASAIITTTSTYAAALCGEYPEAAGKTHVVYLTMPPARPQPLIHRATRNLAGDATDPTLTLLHPGTLYGGAGRNARVLVAALPLLFERRPDARGRVRVRLVGSGPGLAEAAAESRRLLIPGAVSVERPVPPEQLPGYMADADCLVLIKFPGPEHDTQIPGKLFHFLAAERPILALVRDGETAAILRNSGLGLIAPPDDPAAVAEHLVRLWDAKLAGESLVNPARAYIGRFSEENMGDQVNRLLNAVVRNEGAKRTGA